MRGGRPAAVEDIDGLALVSDAYVPDHDLTVLLSPLPVVERDSSAAAASDEIGRASTDALDYGVNRCAQLLYPPSL
jgi:hypothetical protein